MTVAAAVRTRRRLIFVSDTLEISKGVTGPIGQLTGQQPTAVYIRSTKILGRMAGDVQVIVSYAGEFPRSPTALIDELLGDFSRDSPDEIFDRFVPIAQKSCIDSMVAVRNNGRTLGVDPPREPTPIQFLVGIVAKGGLDLAKIDCGLPVRPELNDVVCIGGIDPLDHAPDIGLTPTDVARDAKRALVRSVKRYITSKMNSEMLPLCCITATRSAQIEAEGCPGL